MKLISIILNIIVVAINLLCVFTDSVPTLVMVLMWGYVLGETIEVLCKFEERLQNDQRR